MNNDAHQCHNWRLLVSAGGWRMSQWQGVYSVQCTSVLHSAAAETAETLINLPDPFKTHCHCNVYNYYAAHFPQGAVCQAFLKNTSGHRVSGS